METHLIRSKWNVSRNSRRLLFSSLSLWQFFKIVLSSAIETLPPNFPPEEFEEVVNGDLSSPSPRPRPDKSHPSQTWPTRVYYLADSLFVETDTLKMHHVCELYRSGYDSLTPEVCIPSSSTSIHLTGNWISKMNCSEVTKLFRCSGFWYFLVAVKFLLW